MTELLLGLDVGTTNTKALLATPEGEVIVQAEATCTTHRPRPGWAEQDPDDWWNAVTATTRRVLAQAGVRAEQIVGIGVSGQGCAVTLIDQHGAVIRPAIIWMDSRSEPECEQMRQTCGRSEEHT